MPNNQVADIITDQEMDFARLVLSGTMNDRDAAQAVGLNPDTAAYIKAKPSVCAFMLGHRAAVLQQLAEQEAEGQRRLNLRREQVLDRLLELANISTDITRGSITVQFKALSLIAAIDGLIPDRRASSSLPQRASWPAKQQEKTIHPEPSPALAQEQEEPGLAEAEPAPVPNSASAPRPAADAPSESTVANRSSGSETTPSAPPAPPLPSAPDTRVPFPLRKKRWRR